MSLKSPLALLRDRAEKWELNSLRSERSELFRMNLREIEQFLGAIIGSAKPLAPDHHGISRRNRRIAHHVKGFG